MKSLPICGVRRNYRSIVSSGNKITLTFYAPKEVPLCFVNLIIHDRINVFDEHFHVISARNFFYSIWAVFLFPMLCIVLQVSHAFMLQDSRF